MSEIERYCVHCGAANAAQNEVCFACQQPLHRTGENEPEMLLHERYKLLSQVGAGGFGGVYRAIDTAEEPRFVAVKEITLRGLSAQEAIEATDSFNREVRLLSGLQHVNLPRIRDTFADAEHWYLVMDFIEGETLDNYLKAQAGSKLPLSEVLDIGLQLCAVLNYLHTRPEPIIFRDLKPANVMRTANGHIFLIDFGIARHFTPGKPKDTIPFGSPGYAAPEQYGRVQTTTQADIYSLGVVLHQMITGDDPAENPFHFAPLPSGDGALTELNNLIQRMVVTEPGERPDSSEVQKVLERLAERERRKQSEYRARLDASAYQSIPTANPLMPPARTGITRRKVLTTALSIGGVMVGIGGIAGLGAVCTFLGSHPGVHGVMAIPPPSPGTAQNHLIYRGHAGAITALSWSPDGTMVASGSADKTVQVWRAADGALLYTYLGYDNAITAIDWATATNEKNRIASSGMNDGTVQVWNALQDHTYLSFHSHGRVLALSWQYQSPWVASGGTDNKVTIWNAMTGEICLTYSGHKGEVRAIKWVPVSNTLPQNENLVSAGADGTVQVWNAATGKTVFSHKEHTAGVNALVLLQDTQFEINGPPQAIASASDDKTVRIWDGTGAFTRFIYRGHSAKVNALAPLSFLDYYGLRVASASDDQTVQVWSIQGDHLLTYAEHHAPVKAVAASPVDNRIVSGDASGLVRLWTIDRAGYQ